MASATDNLDPALHAPSTPADDSLKQRLAGHLDLIKRPTDLVRITQVGPAHFRVNTLAATTDADSLLSTYRIVKSQFLHVQLRNDELVITDQTRN